MESRPRVKDDAALPDLRQALVRHGTTSPQITCQIWVGIQVEREGWVRAHVADYTSVVRPGSAWVGMGQHGSAWVSMCQHVPA